MIECCSPAGRVELADLSAGGVDEDSGESTAGAAAASGDVGGGSGARVGGDSR